MINFPSTQVLLHHCSPQRTIDLYLLLNQAHQPLNRVRILDKSTRLGRWGESHCRQILRRWLARRSEIEDLGCWPWDTAVPVRGVVAKTLSDGDGSVTSGGETLDLVFCQGVGGLLVNVMVQDDVV